MTGRPLNTCIHHLISRIPLLGQVFAIVSPSPRTVDSSRALWVVSPPIILTRLLTPPARRFPSPHTIREMIRDLDRRDDPPHRGRSACTRLSSTCHSIACHFRKACTPSHIGTRYTSRCKSKISLSRSRTGYSCFPSRDVRRRFVTVATYVRRGTSGGERAYIYSSE